MGGAARACGSAIVARPGREEDRAVPDRHPAAARDRGRAPTGARRRDGAAPRGARGVEEASEEGAGRHARAGGRRAVERLSSSATSPSRRVADLLKDAPRCILNNDELAAFIGAFDRYQQGGKVSAGRGARPRACTTAARDSVDRVRGSTSTSRTGRPRYSAASSSRSCGPIVADLATDGLLQRFATVVPGRGAGGRRGGRRPGPGPRPRSTLTTCWCGGCGRSGRAKRAGGGFLTVRAGEDAKEPRRRVFRLVERIMADPTLPAPLRETASKWRGLVARLALLFHCIGLAEKTSQTAPRRRAKLGRKSRGAQGDARFLNRGYGRELRPARRGAFGLRALPRAGPDGRPARAVDRRAHPGEPRRADQRHGKSAAFTESLRGDLRGIAHAMELLEHAGWVTGDGHPRRPKWTVDPRVHALFAARAEAEREQPPSHPRVDQDQHR